MTVFRKIMVLGFIGILAGMATWPIVEILLVNQTGFKTYALFNICLGACIGFVFGIFFGMGEGLVQSDFQRALHGAFIGMLIGMCAGVIAFYTEHLILFLLGEVFLSSNRALVAFGIPLARLVGWGLMGMLIGTIEGLRARSTVKIRIGMMSGLIGGIIGGLAMTVMLYLSPETASLRLIGLVLYGGLIGLIYGMIEKRFARGVLKILNGSYKGREYLLIQRKTGMGQSKNAHIRLPDDPQVAPLHARIRITKAGKVELEALHADRPVWVNDKAVDAKRLKYQDVIKLGNISLLYYYA